jgi:putative transposase
MYRALGVSKQAVHQQSARQSRFDAQLLELIADAEALRQQHPGCGVEKMYYKLKPSFVGRDRFIEIMMDTGFRVKRPRNYRRTTYAGKIKYPNLIKGLGVSKPSIIWQSDITYVDVKGKFYYAVFIIDVYSKKIVGYKVSKSMRATANVGALAAALRTHPVPEIHHSDRGSQYGSGAYTKLLQDNHVQISMGLKAQENAYAERINRTIKEEYLNLWKPITYEQLKAQTKKAVDNYNNQRLHDHLNRLTPVEFERRCNDPNFIKPVITIFDDNNI